MANLHTQSYKSFKIKDWFHRSRLRYLKKLVRSTFQGQQTYCDIGCSEGFVTSTLADEFGPSRVVGFDHIEDHLESGRSQFDIEFRWIDLNVEQDVGTFQAVTCLETLEHVGNLEMAVSNVLRAIEPGGSCIISVPDEVGMLGALKGAAKIYGYGYTLKELSDDLKPAAYLWEVLRNRRRISRFREGKVRKGFGTHFGFDYRDVGDLLKAAGVRYEVKKSGTTVFFVFRHG